MRTRFVTQLFWRGPGIYAWCLLLAVPVWWLRRAHPASWPELVVASGAPRPSGAIFHGFEVSVLGIVSLAWAALIAHGLLADRVIAPLQRRRPQRLDIIAVMLPASLLACTRAIWHLLLAGVTIFAIAQVIPTSGIHELVIAQLGLALVTLYGAGQLNRQLGSFIRSLPAPREALSSAEAPPSTALAGPISRATHTMTQLLLLIPLAGIYFGMQSLLVSGLLRRQLLGLGPDLAFAVLGALESLVLVVWIVGGATTWHAYHGVTPALRREVVTDVFA